MKKAIEIVGRSRIITHENAMEHPETTQKKILERILPSHQTGLFLPLVQINPIDNTADPNMSVEEERQKRQILHQRHISGMVLTDIFPDGLRVTPALGQQTTVRWHLVFRTHHHYLNVFCLWPCEFG